jgi:ABC-type transport system involved in cytochrome c biogenesis ATPase subunit
VLSSLLRKISGLQNPKRLTIYADNCTGQNKKNFDAKYLVALVHTDTLERIDLKFFVKRSTKNTVDRGT